MWNRARHSESVKVRVQVCVRVCVRERVCELPVDGAERERCFQRKHLVASERVSESVNKRECE